MTEDYIQKKYGQGTINCAFCGAALTNSNFSKEHVIPNAIGGRKTVSRFICVNCNSSTGSEWDNELVNQLKPLCTLLNIKRGRGKNQPLPVETVKGRKLILDPNGSMAPPKLSFEKHDLGEKTEIKICARSKSELQNTLEDLKKKHPQIDVATLLAEANDVREYSEDPLQFSLEFGGAHSGRSVIKSCLALAFKAGLSIDECEHVKSYLLGDGAPCFGYFYERDLVKNRPENTIFHCVHVCGDPANKQVLAYVEYFSFHRVVACLSSNYDGRAFSHSYAIDPIAGAELDIEIKLKIEPQEITEIYECKKENTDKKTQALEAVLMRWYKQDRERAFADAAEDASAFAQAECGVKPGDLMSDQLAAKLARVATDRITPFLVHLIIGGMYSSESLQEIKRKFQERE